MLLSPITFKSFKGLITNVNYLDNTKISGNILLDCMNIQFAVDGVITSRHGHQEYAAPINSDTLLKDKTWRSMEFPYNIVGINTAYIIADLGNPNPAFSVGLYSLTGVNATPSPVLVEYGGTLGSNFLVGTSAISGIRIPTAFYGNYIRWAQNQSKWYFNASNGLYVENLTDTIDGASGIYSKYTMPYVVETVPSVALSTNNLTNWFVPGYSCKVIAEVVDYNMGSNSDGFIYGLPSSVVELTNTGGYASVFMVPKVNVINKRNLNNLYLRIYRTRQYKFDEIPEEDFFLCLELSLTKGSYNASTQEVSFSSTELPLNDLSITGQGELYTNTNRDGKSGIVVTPPVAKDFVVYKGFGLYANVIRPAWTTCTLTHMPTSGQTMTIQTPSFLAPAGTLTFGTQISIPTNATSPSSLTNGTLTAQQLTYRGPGTGVDPLTIRAYDPALPPATNRYSVPSYARGKGPIVCVPAIGTAATTRTLKITADGAMFDTTKFEAPGILALVRKANIIASGSFVVGDTYVITTTGVAGDFPGASSQAVGTIFTASGVGAGGAGRAMEANVNGQVYDLVTYQDFEKIPNSDKIEFYECVSASKWAQGVAAVDKGLTPYSTSFVSTDVYHVFYLPGSSVNSLSIYLQGADTSGIYLNGYSLVPLLNANANTDLQPYLDTPIAAVGGLKEPPYSDTLGLIPTIDFLGILFKDPVRLLNAQVQNIINTYNQIQSPTLPFMTTLGDPAQFLILGKTVGYDSTTGLQNSINVYKSAGNALDFDLFSSSGTETNINFSEQVDVINGIIISKQGQVESVSFENMTNPLLVGDSKKPIQRVIVNLDQLYVFKEKEGIYRIDLTGGLETKNLVPILVDNSIWLGANESVQIINDSIIFLSNRGVMRLANNQVYDISNDIDKELQEAIAIPTKANIRSFCNPVRLQYGICVGDYTYVLNIRTMDWVKWDLKLGYTYCFPLTGELITQSSDVYNHIRYDGMTGGVFNNPADQVDETIGLAGASAFSFSGNDLTITKNIGNGRFADINNCNKINRYLSKTIWYRSGIPPNVTYYKATFKSGVWGTGLDHKCVITFDPSITVLPTPDASTDAIIIGVNVSVTPHRFFAGGPDTLTKFSKWVAQIQGEVSEMSVKFNVDTTNVAFTGSPLQFTTVKETAITDMPRSYSRGRWITSKVEHSYPYEYFTLLGLTWVAKDLSTFRIKWRN